MPKPLTGKVALITGATRRAGIGAAIARALATAGADIGLGYFRAYDRQQPWGVADAEPQELLAQLRAFGPRAVGFEVDLSRPEGPAELFASVREALGAVHILVNNAAHSAAAPIERLTGEDLDRHYAVNLRAAALLCAEFVRHYPATSGGRIINLTSGQGITPMPAELAYAATKGAVEALTASLSVAVAGLGITVNAVDPGPTDTGWTNRELREALSGRIGTAEDAAKVVAFLASEESARVTGQVIRSRGAG